MSGSYRIRGGEKVQDVGHPLIESHFPIKCESSVDTLVLFHQLMQKMVITLYFSLGNRLPHKLGLH